MPQSKHLLATLTLCLFASTQEVSAQPPPAITPGAMAAAEDHQVITTLGLSMMDVGYDSLSPNYYGGILPISVEVGLSSRRQVMFSAGLTVVGLMGGVGTGYDLVDNRRLKLGVMGGTGVSYAIGVGSVADERSSEALEPVWGWAVSPNVGVRGALHLAKSVDVVSSVRGGAALPLYSGAPVLPWLESNLGVNVNLGSRVAMGANVGTLNTVPVAQVSLSILAGPGE